MPTSKKIFQTSALSMFLASTAFFILNSYSYAQAPGAATDPRSQTLSASTQRVLFSREAFFGTSTTLPRWDNGYLVSHEVENFQPGVANIGVFDLSGSKVNEAKIWFPGSTRLLLYSAVATPDGKIVVGGRTETNDATPPPPFIALIDKSGFMSDVIHTAGFVPVNLCMAPDGTVWSFGGTGYDQHSKPKPGDTLRHFDFRKGELSSYLPRLDFAAEMQPGPENHASIRCSADSISVFSAAAQQYIEMNYSDSAPHVYRAEVPKGLWLTGFAVLTPKKVYAYFSHGPVRGLYQLSFDEPSNSAAWLPVPGTVGDKSSAVAGLWGSDGDSLIISRADDAAGATALHWVTPLNR